MRVTKRGGLRLRLDPGEDALLLMLLGELAAVVAHEDLDDAVVARLYPAAYADDGSAAEYRELTEQTLRSDRADRIRECSADVTAQAPDIRLDDDAADRWLRVLNDMRLALGTRLGVTEDWDHDADPNDPEQLPQVTYLWLTAVQDSLVQALM